MDLNHDTQIQNLQCYRYTTRQLQECKVTYEDKIVSDNADLNSCTDTPISLNRSRVWLFHRHSLYVRQKTLPAPTPFAFLFVFLLFLKERVA